MAPSPKPSLTSRERVRLALDHQQTDRIPIATVCSGINAPARQEFETYLQRERGMSVQDYLAPLIDIQQVSPAYIGPKLGEGEDIWGVVRGPVSYGSGSYNEIRHHPLATASSVDDLRQHRWPDAEWFDYDSLPGRIGQARADADPCLMVANGNVFESAWYMRGFERTFEDLLINPDIAHQILQRVTDFYLEHFRRMLEVADGAVDLAFTADDIGGQNGLLMSLPMWEEFIKPRHAALNQVIHEFGTRVIYHSDGAVMNAVDGLVDMGIDVLQALQFDAQDMDPAVLKRDHGDRLCFQGGVSVQHTLPFGTPKSVRAETENLISVLGADGGYILGPSHAIQAGTPPENIVTMFDTAATYYPFS